MFRAGSASHREDERVEINRVDCTTERSFRDALLVQASSSHRISMHHSVLIATQVVIRNILVSRYGGTDAGGAQPTELTHDHS